jgi:hypothetical protein
VTQLNLMILPPKVETSMCSESGAQMQLVTGSTRPMNKDRTSKDVPAE